jgi:hypothetical protein
MLVDPNAAQDSMNTAILFAVLALGCLGIVIYKLSNKNKTPEN